MDVTRVYVHAFLDGRDTLPTSGAGYIEKLLGKMKEYGIGKLASVSGRYYAMDRDKKWDRERKAFDAMCTGNAEGGRHSDAVAKIKTCYNNGITDEFTIPFVVTDAAGKPQGRSAMKTSSSTSTTAPTAPDRSPASSPARAASIKQVVATSTLGNRSMK